MSFSVRALDKEAQLGEFDCGEPVLNRYLQQMASQDVRRNVARVFVCCPRETPGTVAGFYTLSAAHVQCQELPEAIAKKLPRYPVPVALMGRLAIDQRFQSQGLGAALLHDACQKIQRARDYLAVTGLVVDAKDEMALKFYLHHGFVRLGQSMRLLLPLTHMLSPKP